jgi:hypothetical protein
LLHNLALGLQMLDSATGGGIAARA